MIEIPESRRAHEQEARIDLLESLADFDDTLLENLLEDVIPSTEEIYQSLSRDLQQGLIVPVFFGSAEKDNGIRRVMKALRHESPEVSATAERLGIDGAGEMWEPLEVERVKQGSLKWLRVIDRNFLRADQVNFLDPTSPNFGHPEWYRAY